MSRKSIVRYPVGLNAVQSIMQTATQSNLSFFHNAGTSSITIATLSPSIQQILDLSNNPTCKMIISGYVPQLEYCRLRDCVEGINTVNTIDDKWYHMGIRMKLYEEYNDGLFVKISFDPRKIIKHNIRLDEIVIKDHNVYYSPNIIGIIYVQIQHAKQILSILNTIDHISYGLEGIRLMVGNITNGSNLRGLLAYPDVDILHTTSNNVNQVFELLGLEAARNVIYLELLNKSNDELASGLFADIITREGILLPFSKNSIFTEKKGLLLSMGMERPSVDLTNMYNILSDKLHNSYARIIVGLPPLVGIQYSTDIADDVEENIAENF